MLPKKTEESRSMKKRLTQKQVQALPFLVAGMKGAEVAKQVGVKASTVSEWINHCPSFALELKRLRDESLRDAIGQLQYTVQIASDELQRLLKKAKSDAVRLRACEYVISNFALVERKGCAGAADTDSTPRKFDLNMVLAGLGVAHGV